MDWTAFLGVILVCAIFARLSVYVIHELVVKTSVYYYASHDPVLTGLVFVGGRSSRSSNRSHRSNGSSILDFRESPGESSYSSDSSSFGPRNPGRPGLFIRWCRQINTIVLGRTARTVSFTARRVTGLFSQTKRLLGNVLNCSTSLPPDATSSGLNGFSGRADSFSETSTGHSDRDSVSVYPGGQGARNGNPFGRRFLRRRSGAFLR